MSKNIKQVIKRDYSIEKFNSEKIKNAIIKAILSVKFSKGEKAVITNEDLKLARSISIYIKNLDFEKLHIEDIQDIIENKLITSKYVDVAKAYIKYRYEHGEYRNKLENLDKKVLGIIDTTNKEVINENANKDGNVIPTQIDFIAGITAQDYAFRKMLPPHIVKSHNKGEIHFHDSDKSPFFPEFNCMLIDVPSMFKSGFNMGNAEIEKPRSFITACNVLSQIIAQVASHIYGGNSINEIDIILEPYVKASFEKHFITGLIFLYLKENFYKKYNIDKDLNWLNKNTIKMIKKEFKIKSKITHNNLYLKTKYPFAFKYAEKLTYKEVYDGVQSLEYEINTLHTSQGQTPFTTFGIRGGLSWESRLIQIAIFKNRIKGIGKEGRTPVFPKLIYCLQKGRNMKQNEPNWDIRLLAEECSSKRIYPDIVSYENIVELTGNFKFPMGCRSFLLKYIDSNGQIINNGRFNMGVVTINLPRISLESKGDKSKFFNILNERLRLSKEALLFRYNRLRGVKTKVAPILYQFSGTGARLNPEDKIDELLENGRASISLGYIGLYETVALFYGLDWQENNKEAKEFSLEIMKCLHNATVEWKKETGLGFSVYGTPSEKLCGRFCKLDKEEFGEITGITDKNFYTNSFHFNVEAKVNPYEKLKFEQEYLKYTTGGFINYIETDSLVNNSRAIGEFWDYAVNIGIGHFGINSPIDHCFECDFKGEFEATLQGFRCPHCGNTNPKTSSCIRRVCGYLSNANATGYNWGKQNEIIRRVKHNEVCTNECC